MLTLFQSFKKDQQKTNISVVGMEVFCSQEHECQYLYLMVPLRLAQSRGFDLFVPVSEMILLDCESEASLSEEPTVTFTLYHHVYDSIFQCRSL